MADVFSFTDRKKISEEKAAAEVLSDEQIIEIERKKAQDAYDKFKTGSDDEHRKMMLETLEQIRDLIVAGKLDSYIIICRNAEHGVFLDYTAINQQLAKPPEIYAYSGKLNELQTALCDLAYNGLHMNLKGELYTIEEPMDNEDEME